MATARPAPAERWFYGPWRDLGIGCGLWYAAAFVVLCVYGAELREQGARLAIPFVALLVSTPHYGATLLRAYEQRADRRAYTLFTLHATVVLFALFAWGAWDALVASWILTVYITWSPWHYAGQNYGLTVMFLRRRGVGITGGAKRLLYASFLLSYALTFLALHAGAPASSYVPVAYDDTTVRFLSIGLRTTWAEGLFFATAVAYLGALAVTVTWLLRRAPLADLVPAFALLGTQGLWFSVPLLLRHWNVETGLEPWESPDGAYYFLWIASGHAAQYLWVTSYYARAGGGTSGAATARYFAKVMLAGAAVWTLPALLFAPGLLGRMPFDAGLAVLIAATVNLHHFILDGAIWKLRDGRVARVLLRSREPTPDAPIGPGRLRIAPVIWVVGAVCTVILFGAKLETDVRLRRALASGDPRALQGVAERLAWIGRDSASLRVTLGRTLAQAGSSAAALREYERSLAIRPSATAWQLIAGLRLEAGDHEAAVAAYRKATALEPDRERLHYELGIVLARQGHHAEARDAFARAAEINPERGINRTLLERERRAAEGDPAP